MTREIKKMQTVIILKNDLFIFQESSYNTDVLKESLPEKLKPYFKDAVYYGKEETYLDGEKFTLLYNYWFI